MMAAWMMYAIVTGTFVAAAAWTVERGFHVLRWQARGVWLGALVATLILPLLAGLRPTRVSGSSDVTAMVPAIIATRMTDAVAASVPIGLDQALTVVWIAGSLLVLSMVVTAQWSLWREVRDARDMTVDGIRVFVTPRLGPAAVLGRGVVLPEWVLAAASTSRALIVRHEREHADRHDAAVLLIGTLSLVAMPWNLTLWWQVRRLRDAVELDCDRRLLVAGVDTATYGAVLLDVAERNLGGGLRAVAALLERPALLARRVVQMSRPRPKTARAFLRVTGLLTTGVVLFVIACAAPGPRERVVPAVADVPQRLSMAALQYPPLLRQAGIEGTVLLVFDVRPDGTVDSASVRVVESSHRAFQRPAMDAMRTARYTVTRDGARGMRQTINFRLGSPPGEHLPADRTTDSAITYP